MNQFDAFSRYFVTLPNIQLLNHLAVANIPGTEFAVAVHLGPIYFYCSWWISAGKFWGILLLNSVTAYWRKQFSSTMNHRPHHPQFATSVHRHWPRLTTLTIHNSLHLFMVTTLGWPRLPWRPQGPTKDQDQFGEVCACGVFQLYGLAKNPRWSPSSVVVNNWLI